MMAYPRLSKAGGTASWLIPAAVTLVNVLLVVAVSAGTRVALAVVGVLAVAFSAALLRRPRGTAPLPEPPDPPGSFTEDLELTVWIGATPKGDRILERRRTRPAHRLAQRKLSPISPYVATDTDKVSITPTLRVKNAPVEASWMPIDTAGRGIVHFVPAVTRETLEWELDYTIPGGLWNPLRSVGLDVFRYDVRTFPIGRFSILFMFAANVDAVSVQERNRRGTTSYLERGEHGGRSILWTADVPTLATRYEWDIRVDWADGPA
ncbi:hypothetical protein [Actinoplanes regularis]|uniref:Uncharacterized protein n=1 Tax=Actinoplanes regularis TaxID=52697 RepID=A0A239EPF6_9ACTN|nr:hypothetical protein [Actinoplanes regularis]GIE89859.1 hypothetical protein Are01nite_63390 [Actinoplanes regularis]SNS46291.1 hypothetical protein SAMN06264365_11633 [Actinoplanes regularis]